MSAALLGSLVIFCLISLGEHIGIFLLTLKAWGNKNSHIKKRLNNILITIKLKSIFTEG